MVAKFHSGQSLNKAVNYNEDKVSKGDAELLHAHLYPKDSSDLTFHEKLNRLQLLASLNQRVRTNCVHVSLNFHPSECLAPATLEHIASEYMKRIGFVGQPYLLYEHRDAGHPHLHIVSTNIRKDGSRISLHNIGRNQSEQARKELEKEFGLMPAGEQKKEEYRLISPPANAVQYGKTETIKAISDVVAEVVRTFKFTSLPELNAVLRQFNVLADRGSEESVLFRKGGLQYRILDDTGNRIGVPVKASTVRNKPTLKMLEVKFQINDKLRQPHAAALKSASTPSYGTNLLAQGSSLKRN